MMLWSPVKQPFHFASCLGIWYEPRHVKTNKLSVRPAKTQVSLGIRPVRSESSLCAQWVAKDPRFLHADCEDSDQTGQMPRLIWVFAGRTLTLLVLSCCGSYYLCCPCSFRLRKRELVYCCFLVSSFYVWPCASVPRMAAVGDCGFSWRSFHWFIKRFILWTFCFQSIPFQYLFSPTEVFQTKLGWAVLCQISMQGSVSTDLAFHWWMLEKIFKMFMI